MINVKKLIDNAMLELDFGGKMEIKCSKREADSLRVRLHREIKKLREVNATLADSFWVSKTNIEEDLFMITLGRGLLKEDQDKITITKADGTNVPYNSIFEVAPEEEFDIKRMKQLMEQDGIDPEEQRRILGDLDKDES